MPIGLTIGFNWLKLVLSQDEDNSSDDSDSNSFLFKKNTILMNFKNRIALF